MLWFSLSLAFSIHLFMVWFIGWSASCLFHWFLPKWCFLNSKTSMPHGCLKIIRYPLFFTKLSPHFLRSTFHDLHGQVLFSLSNSFVSHFLPQTGHGSLWSLVDPGITHILYETAKQSILCHALPRVWFSPLCCLSDPVLTSEKLSLSSRRVSCSWLHNLIYHNSSSQILVSVRVTWRAG